MVKWSEFESRWSLEFFWKIGVEKNENKSIEAEVGPLKHIFEHI